MHFITGNLITIIPLIMIIFLVHFDPVYQGKTRRFFLSALCITVVESALEIFTVVNTEPTPTAALFTAIANAVGFALAPFVGFFVLSMAMQQTPLEKHRLFLLIPAFINAGLSIASIWSGFVFRVTTDNIYARGPLFGLQLVLNLCYIVLFVILDFSQKKQYKLSDMICIWTNYVLILSSFLLQILFPRLLLIWGCISISFIFYYIIFQNMQLRRDFLTGLYTRRMYDYVLNQQNQKVPLVIISIDLNKFKQINDTYGHVFGDDVLRESAQAVSRYFDSVGYTYRIGGDEFCVITNRLDPDSIPSFFEEIERDLLPISEKIAIMPLLSYGYAVFDPKISNNIYDTIKAADTAMYSYKKEHLK